MDKNRAAEKVKECKLAFEKYFGIAPTDSEVKEVLLQKLAEKKKTWLENYLTDRSPEDINSILRVVSDKKEPVVKAPAAPKVVESAPVKKVAKKKKKKVRS